MARDQRCKLALGVTNAPFFESSMFRAKLSTSVASFHLYNSVPDRIREWALPNNYGMETLKISQLAVETLWG